MSKGDEWRRPPAPESVSRLLNFSDAVVAIAVTLLVLPLIDIEPPANGETVWNVISDNSGQFTAFLVSFLITLIYWRRHHVMLDGLKSFTNAFVMLSVFWLLLMVLFQFPSKMVGEASEGDGSATLYLWYLAGLAAMTVLLEFYIVRHPELTDDGKGVDPYQFWWGLTTVALMVVAATASFWIDRNALYLLLLLMPLGWIEGSWMSRHEQTAGSPTGNHTPGT